MQTIDNLGITGKIHLSLIDEFGNIKEERSVNNLVVTVGKAFLTAAIGTITTSIFNYMAIGSSGTAVAAGNTTLGTELARVVIASNTPVSNTTTIIASFPAGTGTGTLEECGIFNAASSGSMLSRATFGIITKGATDTITLTWVITVG